MPRPLIIAHRGASGERPEHTRAAYALAIDQGADFIEPDLVMSRDRVLVVRHETGIGGTTDVADRPEFADRRATRIIDSRSVTGWFVEDFTLDELKTLRARERLPELRPDNRRWDGAEPILTFLEVLDIAREGAQRTGRTIGVAPELKHPSYLTGLGLRIEDAFASAARACEDVPLIGQCFEVGPLKRMPPRVIPVRMQLIAASGGPADRAGEDAASLTTWKGLAGIAAYAAWIGVEACLATHELIDRAHAAGLKVAVWTVRAENAFLPDAYRRGDDPAAHGDVGNWARDLAARGADALFCDQPGLVGAAFRA